MFCPGRCGWALLVFRQTSAILLLWVLLAGCGEGGRQAACPAGPRPELLAVQQAKVYPETSTGMFISLVDFEDTPGGRKGYEQVELFSIEGEQAGGELSFVVNITRTGAGAMEVHLPAGAELALDVGDFHDFSGYCLVSMALFSDTLRDDLTVTLNTHGASWTSHRTLVKPGWNTVLIDIQRLESQPGFDITGVERISLGFADAAGPVRFNLDDVMLVDNRRRIKPVPKGVSLSKQGLDYEVRLPGRPQPVGLAQCDDGLWRLSDLAPTFQAAGPGQTLPAAGERLGLMGRRKVGQVELLEHNAVRVRLANTWYFPKRSGEWLSLAVRRIRWNYTIYTDGRWVTHVELNNAGGSRISSVRMWLTEEVAWSAGVVAADLVIRDFLGPVGRWSFLLAPKTLRTETLYRNYVRPGRVRPTIAAEDVYAPGDIDRDRFDESQGCYSLAAVRGHCRFTVVPPEGGLLDPAFMVTGLSEGPVCVNAQGLAVRNVVKLPDGAALFIIPGWIRQPTAVEVTGKALDVLR